MVEKGMALELDGAVEVTVVLRPGVYALVKAGTVIYVGKSKSVYQRIYTHRSTASRAARGKPIPSWLPLKGFVFDQVFVWPCALEDLDALEAEKINLYQPKFNESIKDGLLRGKLPLTVRVGGVPLTLNGGPKPVEGPVMRR